jgi:hypothetical protein
MGEVEISEFSSGSKFYPPVAQLDNAQAYEASGWEFESLRADQFPSEANLVEATV